MQLLHDTTLSYNLKDESDVTRVIKDLCRKANCILYTFKFLDPVIKTFLFKSYCLSLYGCILWSLSSASLKCLQISINKILRKIWHLPRHSHTSIVLCVAKLPYIHEIIYKRFTSFFQRCLQSHIPLIRYVFQDSLHFIYTFSGYNYLFGNIHLNEFNYNDLNLAHIIRSYRIVFGNHSPHETYISAISTL